MQDFAGIWLDINGVQQVDGDDVPDVAASVTLGNSSCQLSDADPNPTLDDGEGFGLTVNAGTGSGGAQCDLTVID